MRTPSVWDSPDSLLKELIDPRTDPARKKEVYQSLQELGSPKEQSVLGGTLGGLGAGALGAFVGLKGGRALGEKLKTKNPGFLKGLGEYFSGGLEYTLGGKQKAKDLEDEIAEIGPTVFGQNYGKDMLGNIGAGLVGGPAVGIGALYGGDMLGTPGQYQGADNALARMSDPNISPEEKKKLSAQYQEHLKRLEAASGSGLGAWAAGTGVQLPLMLAMNYGGGKRLGEMMIPDHKLPTSGFANTKTGRDLMGELGFDTVVANPLGGAATTLALNATRGKYESPFDENQRNQ